MDNILSENTTKFVKNFFANNCELKSNEKEFVNIVTKDLKKNIDSSRYLFSADVGVVIEVTSESNNNFLAEQKKDIHTFLEENPEFVLFEDNENKVLAKDISVVSYIDIEKDEVHTVSLKYEEENLNIAYKDMESFAELIGRISCVSKSNDLVELDLDAGLEELKYALRSMNKRDAKPNPRLEILKKLSNIEKVKVLKGIVCEEMQFIIDVYKKTNELGKDACFIAYSGLKDMSEMSRIVVNRPNTEIADIITQIVESKDGFIKFPDDTSHKDSIYGKLKNEFDIQELYDEIAGVIKNFNKLSPETFIQQIAFIDEIYVHLNAELEIKYIKYVKDYSTEEVKYTRDPQSRLSSFVGYCLKMSDLNALKFKHIYKKEINEWLEENPEAIFKVNTYKNIEKDSSCFKYVKAGETMITSKDFINVFIYKDKHKSKFTGDQIDLKGATKKLQEIKEDLNIEFNLILKECTIFNDKHTIIIDVKRIEEDIYNGYFISALQQMQKNFKDKDKFSCIIAHGFPIDEFYCYTNIATNDKVEITYDDVKSCGAPTLVKSQYLCNDSYLIQLTKLHKRKVEEFNKICIDCVNSQLFVNENFQKEENYKNKNDSKTIGDDIYIKLADDSIILN